jgi:uncharacterized protein
MAPQQRQIAPRPGPKSYNVTGHLRHGQTLKLHLESRSALNALTAYGEGYVMVNGERIERSVVVLPERILTDWPAASFAELAPEHFAALADLGCEIVLLGTGMQLRFPRPEIVHPLIRAGIGIEVMDLPAACRTYNILMAEERKVAAALLFA